MSITNTKTLDHFIVHSYRVQGSPWLQKMSININNYTFNTINITILLITIHLFSFGEFRRLSVRDEHFIILRVHLYLNIK
jgi:hypothetical protein